MKETEVLYNGRKTENDHQFCGKKQQYLSEKTAFFEQHAGYAVLYWKTSR